MARPKKDNAEYYSHDNNMRNDPKVKALRKRFPIVGYAVYNMLLEVLTEAENLTIEITPLTLELYAGDFDLEAEILAEIINYGVKIELLRKERDWIFSAGLKKRLQPVFDKRKSAKDKFLQRKQENSGVSVSETTQSKVKESKVKYTTTTEGPSSTPPVVDRSESTLLRPLQEIADFALKDEAFQCESAQRANIPPEKLPDFRIRLPDLMEAFVQHKRSEGHDHDIVINFRKHFKNWLPKRLKDEATGKVASARTTDEYLEQRRKNEEKTRKLSQ